MSLQEFLGFLVLYGIHNPSAESRILDGNLPIDYRELDISLADIFVASEPSSVSTSTMSSSTSTVLATVGPYQNMLTLLVPSPFPVSLPNVTFLPLLTTSPAGPMLFP
ncbi:unnamed protein product [[Candida] boidinii]|nr:unnamed protein product [[Candida] boidinii]